MQQRISKRAYRKTGAPTAALSQLTAVLILLVVTLAAAGCSSESPSSSGQSPAGKTTAAAPQAPVSQVKAPPANVPGPDEDARWGVVYMQGRRIGYTWETTTAAQENGQEVVHRQAEFTMKMQRFGAVVETAIKIQSIEDKAENLKRFETVMKAGSTEFKSAGQVQDGKLTVQLSTLGAPVKETIDWNGDIGGPFARELSLRTQPMKPGEKRSLRMLVPMQTAPARVEMKAIGYEDTKMLNGTRNLLRIEAVNITKQGGIETKIPETIFVDSAGVTMKSVIPMMQQEVYATTRSVALGDFDPAEFDLGEMSIVKVDAPAGFEDREQAKYRVRLTSSNPKEQFASGGAQTVESVDDRTATITVSPAHAAAANKDDQPSDADLASNGLIQSDDPLIVKLAAGIAPGEKNATRLAQAIEKFVFTTIDEKTFTQVFATAAEVAKSREGDCTEHGVLLAALARARELPARVVFGLVYVRQFGGFGYHMWTEVWTGDRWLALDGTLGQGGITHRHIKIGHSNLKGAGPLSAMLPAVTVMGNVAIELLP